MNLPRRQVLQGACAALAIALVVPLTHAQPYPTKPVRLIIGYPPGGSADITARLMAQWLSERLAQPFIVESRAGGGTNIATELGVHATPDGYTLLVVSPANAIKPSPYCKLNYKFRLDISPIAPL